MMDREEGKREAACCCADSGRDSKVKASSIPCHPQPAPELGTALSS